MVRANSFSSPEAQRIARITYRQLDYWIRTGLVRPSIGAKGSGTRRAFSYRDLVAVRAIAALKAAGVSLQAIRSVQRKLVEFEGSDDALRTGRLVIEQDRPRPEVAVAIGESEVLRLLREPGQSAMRTIFEMAPVYQAVDDGIEKILDARTKAAARKEKAA
jgi:DNA-binding transcriptional MerR regulator